MTVPQIDIPATLYAGLLFAGYAALWAFKRRSQFRATGVDPDMFAQRPPDGLQRYLSGVKRALQA